MNSQIVLFLAFVSFATASWWEHAVFYQIYPRSFKDSNNDGVGDLQGIISKMNYFHETGIDAIWLSPIFESPQVDQGYDISDYKHVDPDYGTDEDLKELIEKAHDLGIKLILDFVPNHTSDQMKWFKDSVARKEPFTDFYVWADGKRDANGTLQPPNNWMSIFGGSAWTYNEDRKQFFLHQFARQQPDLNYQNPEVIEAMDNILLYWLDQGVDGFRVDAIPHLVEDEELRDEPFFDENGVQDYFSMDHIYTKDAPGTYEIVYHWRSLVDNYTRDKGGDDRILMTEAYATLEKTMLYYGTKDGSELGAHFSFNFFLITQLNQNSTAKNISAVINEWLTAIPNIYKSNWVLGNHDNFRVATRFGPKNVDGFNMLVAVLPGIGVTYNGEEIGQENGDVPFSAGQDPSARDPLTFAQKSRDFERTPFQWNSNDNAGFNDGAKPWLPVSGKFLKTNLAVQVAKKESHYIIYREVLKLRKEAPLQNGTVLVKDVGARVIMVKRCDDGDCMVLFFNNTDDDEVIDVTDWVPDINRVILTSEKSKREKGYAIVPTNLKILGHEALIVRF